MVIHVVIVVPSYLHLFSQTSAWIM